MPSAVTQPYVIFETETEFEKYLQMYYDASVRANVQRDVILRGMNAIRDFFNTVRMWRDAA